MKNLLKVVSFYAVVVLVSISSVLFRLYLWPCWEILFLVELSTGFSLRQSFQQVASLNLVAKRVVANSAALCSGRSAWLLYYCLSAEFLEKYSRIILPADHKGTIKLFEKATQSKVAKEARLTLFLYSAQASVSSQYLFSSFSFAVLLVFFNSLQEHYYYSIKAYNLEDLYQQKSNSLLNLTS